jgi:hypothetical protein
LRRAGHESALYEFDPYPESDANFVAGELGHLVVGNRVLIDRDPGP